MSEWISDLERLRALKSEGMISESEYQISKLRVLGNSKSETTSRNDIVDGDVDDSEESPDRGFTERSSRKSLMAWILAAVIAGMAAGFAYWYVRPSVAAPARATGKSWSSDCQKRPAVQWGTGYQLRSLNGSLIVGQPATFSARPNGWWVSANNQSDFYAIDGENLHLEEVVAAGISIRPPVNTLHACSAVLETAGNFEPTETAPIENGLLLAVGFGDVSAIKKFISKIGNLNSLKNIETIKGVASISSPEIYKLIMAGMGQAISEPDKDFAASGRPWVKAVSIPDWMDGEFSYANCSVGSVQYSGSSERRMWNGKEEERRVAKAISTSGNHVRLSYDDGSRVFFAPASNGAIKMLGSTMPTGAPTPGSKVTILQRCAGGVSSPSIVNENAGSPTLGDTHPQSPTFRMAGAWVPKGESCDSGSGLIFEDNGVLSEEDSSGTWSIHGDSLETILNGEKTHGTVRLVSDDQIIAYWDGGENTQFLRCK